jgi:hypothetical protein
MDETTSMDGLLHGWSPPWTVSSVQNGVRACQEAVAVQAPDADQAVPLARGDAAVRTPTARSALWSVAQTLHLCNRVST